MSGPPSPLVEAVRPLPDTGLIDMYARWQNEQIRQALASVRVVTLSGARQTGKTTLAKTFATDTKGYRSLDDPGQLAAALHDPMDFVRSDTRLMIIDEVQKAPDLLSAIKHEVDIDQRRGRYLLTGSAVISALPTVRESLAGRAWTIRLGPLTQGEIKGKPPTFLERALGMTFREREGDYRHLDDPLSGHERNRWIAAALGGGYPEALACANETLRTRWYRRYLSAVFNRDLQDVARVRRKKALEILAVRLAAWSSKGIDLTKIGEGLGISRPTVESYVNTLEAMCLIDRVPAWVDTEYEWGMRRDKLFMADSGLMGSVLGWDLNGVRIDGDACGKLLETFVCNQLTALVDTGDPEHRLFHFRDRRGREVDFVVESHADEVLGIEVKAATRVGAEDARHLQWFGDTRAKGRRFVGLVLHAGGGVRRLSEKVWAVPHSYLWE